MPVLCLLTTATYCWSCVSLYMDDKASAGAAVMGFTCKHVNAHTKVRQKWTGQ